MPLLKLKQSKYISKNNRGGQVPIAVKLATLLQMTHRTDPKDVAENSLFHFTLNDLNLFNTLKLYYYII
jgi:hypothetical protein